MANNPVASWLRKRVRSEPTVVASALSVLPKPKVHVPPPPRRRKTRAQPTGTMMPPAPVVLPPAEPVEPLPADVPSVPADAPPVAESSALVEAPPSLQPPDEPAVPPLLGPTEEADTTARDFVELFNGPLGSKQTISRTEYMSIERFCLSCDCPIEQLFRRIVSGGDALDQFAQGAGITKPLAERLIVHYGGIYLDDGEQEKLDRYCDEHGIDQASLFAAMIDNSIATRAVEIGITPTKTAKLFAFYRRRCAVAVT